MVPGARGLPRGDELAERQVGEFPEQISRGLGELFEHRQGSLGGAGGQCDRVPELFEATHVVAFSGKVDITRAGSCKWVKVQESLPYAGMSYGQGTALGANLGGMACSSTWCAVARAAAPPEREGSPGRCCRLHRAS